MYYISKKLEISSSHKLKLNYDSKCNNLHGHNWKIIIFCKAEKLDENGMVIDFAKIKEKIMNMLDHTNLNNVFNFNPTAENIARWICENIEKCYKVEIQESEGNRAIYEY